MLQQERFMVVRSGWLAFCHASLIWWVKWATLVNWKTSFFLARRSGVCDILFNSWLNSWEFMFPSCIVCLQMLKLQVLHVVVNVSAKVLSVRSRGSCRVLFMWLLRWSSLCACFTLLTKTLIIVGTSEFHIRGLDVYIFGGLYVEGYQLPTWDYWCTQGHGAQAAKLVLVSFPHAVHVLISDVLMTGNNSNSRGTCTILSSRLTNGSSRLYCVGSKWCFCAILLGEYGPCSGGASTVPWAQEDYQPG